MAKFQKTYHLIRARFIVLLSICLIAGCQTGHKLKDDSVNPSSITNAFNLDVRSLRSVSISWPDNVTRDSRVMEVLLAQLTLTEHRNLDIKKQRLSANHYQIEVLNKQITNGVNKSTYHIAEVLKEDGIWRLKSLQQALGCQNIYLSSC